MSENSNPGVDVVRAWKDEEYRNNLTPEQLASLPPNPAGEIELTENDLDEAVGGAVKLQPTPVHTFENPDCKFIVNGGKPSPF